MTAPDFLNPQEVDLLKRTILKDFSDDEKESFIRTCQRTRLDPFTRPPQIYATKRMQKVYDGEEERKVYALVIITSIQGATAVADRTGKYDGCVIHWCGRDAQFREVWLDDDPPAAARAVVFHKERSHPEVAIARWKSYKGEQYDAKTRSYHLTAFWKKMDDYMLSKCAKMAALRGAFPNQLGGLYLSEELQGDLIDTESTELPKGLKPDQVKFVDSTKPVNADPEKAELQAERRAEVAQGIEDRAKQAASPQPPTQEDDIPMGEPQAAQPPTLAAEEAGAAPDEAWKEHLITSIKKDPRFAGKKVGEVNPLDLNKLQVQFIDRVRKNWEDASPEQQADCVAFEAALAAQKVAMIT